MDVLLPLHFTSMVSVREPGSSFADNAARDPVRACLHQLTANNRYCTNYSMVATLYLSLRWA